MGSRTAVSMAGGGMIKRAISQLLGYRPSARVLGKNLEATGIKRPAQTAAHHIVAGNAKKAAKARAVLRRFGIDINLADNGVFLPKNLSAAATQGSSAAVHSVVHTNAYYDAVNKALAKARTRDDALAILGRINHRLQQGGFP